MVDVFTGVNGFAKGGDVSIIGGSGVIVVWLCVIGVDDAVCLVITGEFEEFVVDGEESDTTGLVMVDDKSVMFCVVIIGDVSVVVFGIWLFGGWMVVVVVDVCTSGMVVELGNDWAIAMGNVKRRQI